MKQHTTITPLPSRRNMTRRKNNLNLKQIRRTRTRSSRSAFAVALVFKSKQTHINNRIHERRRNTDRPNLNPNPIPIPPENTPATPTGKIWELRARPRRFAISFVVPDRTAAEISDKPRVRGSQPLRITRIPDGGPVGFYRVVQVARQEGQPMSHCLNNGDSNKPDPKRAYHRSRINDWYLQLFHHSVSPQPPPQESQEVDFKCDSKCDFDHQIDL